LISTNWHQQHLRLQSKNKSSNK